MATDWLGIDCFGLAVDGPKTPQLQARRSTFPRGSTGASREPAPLGRSQCSFNLRPRCPVDTGLPRRNRAKTDASRYPCASPSSERTEPLRTSFGVIANFCTNCIFWFAGKPVIFP